TSRNRSCPPSSIRHRARRVPDSRRFPAPAALRRARAPRPARARHCRRKLPASAGTTRNHRDVALALLVRPASERHRPGLADAAGRGKWRTPSSLVLLENLSRKGAKLAKETQRVCLAFLCVFARGSFILPATAESAP